MVDPKKWERVHLDNAGTGVLRGTYDVADVGCRILQLHT